MTVAALHVGLPRLVASEEGHEDPSIADMRRAIIFGARESRLIRECLEVAESRDLPEEEMYIWLAYHALVCLDELHQACRCSRGVRAAPLKVNPEVEGNF
jgi:hypothetical protein